MLDVVKNIKGGFMSSNIKKILFISNVSKELGSFSYSSMAAAKEHGYDFHIAVNCSYLSTKEINDYEVKYGITIHNIHFNRNPFNPTNLVACKQLMQLMRNEHFDMVHCNTPIGGILGRYCSNKVKIKKIVYMAHGFHFYKGASLINITLFKWAEMFMAHYTDAIITINKEDYVAAKKFKLRNCGKVYYIPGVGVDTEYISNAKERRKEFIEELGIDNNTIIIISVGELNKNKNNHVIIRALKILRNPNIHYVLCGEGKRQHKLISLAKKNNLESNIHFIGYRKDIPQLLKSSDIYVLPSHREGLSCSLMEAMAVGLPCIVSSIRGNVDLIEESKGGYLCKPNDYRSFAKAIAIISADAEMRKILGNNNVQTIKNCDVQNIKSMIKEIYHEMLE